MYCQNIEEFVDSNLPEIVAKYTEEIIDILEEKGFTVILINKDSSKAGG